MIEQEFYNLLLQVEHLTDEEQNNLKNILDYKTKIRPRILDEINRLAFKKREINKEILEKFQILDNADKMLAGVLV